MTETRGELSVRRLNGEFEVRSWDEETFLESEGG
jgi:hypothetical protein